MNGPVRLATAALLGAVLAVAGLRFSSSDGAGPPGPPREAAAAIDDLLRELQIVPLGGQRPHPFTLPTLGGGPVALADLGGRPALLYFWATW